ncbi:dual specificity protein phosphatase 18 [Pygocentrus nattereri]|uniref:dual specificity protein phosphatase 18 n=1 Tax=Pygocentrus nattereri TaxID=42514 RepID=UPI001890B77F|nr:dual specificity protein phosphatase 18 [Pygocentrus nattereri]
MSSTFKAFVRDAEESSQPDISYREEEEVLFNVHRSYGSMVISQITPSLYLSGVEAVNPAALAHRRVTLLVLATDELLFPEPASVELVRVPIRDEPHAPLSQHFDAVVERIQQNRSGSTLVCCAAGRSRSPALVMAFLIKNEGLSLLQAHQRVLEARPFIRPNAGFWRQLQEYERQLRHCNSVRMVATSQGVLPEAVGQTQDGPYCLNV